MRIRSLALCAQLCFVGMVPLVAGCSDDDETSPTSDLIGTWNVTSFVATDLGDLIDQGMTMEVELTNSSTYVITVTGDLVDICDPGPDCTQNGNFSADQQTITIDPGVDAVTFNWVRNGDTMTWTGTIGGTPVTIILEEA